MLAKHSKNFSLQNALSIGVDDMQRNFKPMVEGVELWREQTLSDVSARLVIYRAFIEGELEVPRQLARNVHDLYFNPETRPLPMPRRENDARVLSISGCGCRRKESSGASTEAANEISS